MSADTDTYFATFDRDFARKSLDEARKYLEINIAYWERLAAKLDAWQRAGGRGPCPLPDGCTAFDVAIIRNGLNARKQGRAA